MPSSAPTLRRPRANRRVSILALALFVATGPGLASRPQGSLRVEPHGTELPVRGAELPVRWWCDYPLATVSIEGRGPFTFLIDTGASACVVDLDMAELFPERLAPRRLRAVGAQGESVGAAGVLTLAELRVGELTLAGLEALVLDLDPASEALRTPLDGVLGYGAFAGLLLELDYPDRAVRVRRGSLPRIDGCRVLELLPGSVPRVSLGLGLEQVAVVLDSGSGGSLDLERWPLGVEHAFGPVDDLGALTVGGLGRPREIARLALDLSLGHHVVRRPVAGLSGGAARVGARLLRHFAWTFDPAGGRVGIERDGDEPIAAEAVRTSGLALVLREEHLLVRAVLPGSPAERAGVRPGDRVRSLGGRPIDEYAACDALQEWVASSHELSAELERAGERFELTWDVLVLLP